VGRADVNVLVWNTAYTRDGNAWVPLTLSGSSAGGSWLRGAAIAALTFSTAVPSKNVIAYVCFDTGPQFDCGSGPSLTGFPGLWRLQKVTPILPPPTGSDDPPLCLLDQTSDKAFA
jgi:hypothetical protein